MALPPHVGVERKSAPDIVLVLKQARNGIKSPFRLDPEPVHMNRQGKRRQRLFVGIVFVEKMADVEHGAAQGNVIAAVGTEPHGGLEIIAAGLEPVESDTLEFLAVGGECRLPSHIKVFGGNQKGAHFRQALVFQGQGDPRRPRRPGRLGPFQKRQIERGAVEICGHRQVTPGIVEFCPDQFHAHRAGKIGPGIEIEAAPRFFVESGRHRVTADEGGVVGEMLDARNVRRNTLENSASFNIHGFLRHLDGEIALGHVLALDQPRQGHIHKISGHRDGHHG